MPEVSAKRGQFDRIGCILLDFSFAIALISYRSIHMPFARRLSPLALFLGAMLLISGAQAAELPATPTSPKAWINSDPIDLNKLKGKVVALVFFEEL